MVHLCGILFTPPGLEYTATTSGLQTWISELQDQFRGDDGLECQAVVDVSFINTETGTVPFPETVLILPIWDNLGQCGSVCVCTCRPERVQAKDGRHLSRREPEVLVPVRLHPPAHTPSLFLSLPPYVMFLHICHSGNRKRKGGKEQWRERKRGT